MLTMNKTVRAIAISFLSILSITSVSAQEQLLLTLEECRKAALECSEDIKKSDNSREQAVLDRKIVTTNALPKIQATATGMYVYPDIDMMGMNLMMRGTYLAGINLVQPIYVGGKISAGRKLASIGEEVAVQQSRQTRATVIENVDNAYWTLIAVRQKVQMIESYQAQMDSLYGQIQVALSTGMATESELLTIKAHRGDMDYQLMRARNGENMCRLMLCQLIGADPEAEIVLTDSIIGVEPPSVASASIENRPELALLNSQVEVAHQNIKMVRADYLPTVGLSIGYNYFGNIKLDGDISVGPISLPMSQKFDQGIGMALLSVKIPIFQWGQGAKKIKRARLDLANAELDLQKNTRLMNMEVKQAVNNLNEGYVLINAAETSLDQAEENLRVTRNRYNESMATLAELLDAQSQWQSASSNVIEAKTQYMLYYTNYLKVIGELE